MGSKHIPEEEFPPPYSVHAGDHSAQEGSLTTQLQQHLASLPTRIRQTQEAHSVQLSLDDGSLHTTPKLAHLTLIPEAVVPPDAILSGMEEMRQRGEPCRVARVKLNLGSNEKKSPAAHESSQAANNSQEWSPGREFSDWGRFGESPTAADPSQSQNTLWWRDEDMARRLARRLQPTNGNEPAPLQTPVQETVEERLPAQKEKKGWFWGKKANTGSTSTFAAKTVQVDVETFPGRGNATLPPAKKNAEKERGGARMFVTAEEVAFRTENALGLMESSRGWAIVVAVQSYFGICAFVLCYSDTLYKTRDNPPQIPLRSPWLLRNRRRAIIPFEETSRV
ncbi:hypothetical protein GQX73_g10494 [Xylaria multiplex]|uniref:Uncharacterized protein n=1 Tax=Xylaria multiplex TaxID=323545 RepID=A0A7C8IST3_9PEZI|nr:hypothetical protein GQX73_g10494 [Xylaria multiplex]